MITPARINDISLDIADVYAHITDELLVNIGKHITSPNWTHTASWEIQKLSELGQLTQENAAIINKWIKSIPQDLRDAMEETRKAALDTIEKQMEDAAKKGYVTPAETDSTVQVLRDMQNQAADRLNLVNTTMLQSSVDQYTRAVLLTQEEYDKLMAQKEATQRVLNEGATSVAAGVETRRTAVRRAITRISAEGLTGFIDRAGRHWSPEAYVNMDIRTTVHNTAIQATKARMQDFGTQVFQVSSHAGARPLCYPYQGKFYSWDNTSGAIELGDGSVVDYAPLNSTTYGQAAGLFGINCGHYPIPIIPGITIPHGADNIQPEEENAKAYAESQEQRALERKIREAKRVVEMAGDAATDEDKAKVRELQKQMREFIDRTGRTRRYDREQIGGTPKPRAQTGQSGENVNRQLTGNETENVTITQKPFAFTRGAEYAFDDLTHTVEKGYAFGDGTANGVRKTANADVYETPDGTRFVFPTSYNKRNQTLDPLTLLDAYNQIPAEIRRLGQREIVVQDVYNPQDAYWRKVYKNFGHSYAVGGEEITFWRYEYLHDHDYLVYSISHEMGHLIDWDGHYASGSRLSEGAEWLKAMAADLAHSGRASPTEYGENSPVEDFAESIANMGKDMASFKTDFPNRYAILEELLTKGSAQT